LAPRFGILINPFISIFQKFGLLQKTLDEMRKKKMMRRRKTLMKELGFLPWPNVLYL
jgi:hypothetical protein